MTEKEKREMVVKGLECLAKQHGIVGVCEPENCPYGDLHTCANEIARDAIALLKAQEPVKPYGMYSEHIGKKWLTCGACNQPMVKMTPDAVYPNYCPECGRMVKRG